jgi:NAD-dependent SIR2 family protein deacetylase
MKSTLPSRITDLLARSSRILVVTGAGVSTGSGIPDFRSPDGLYSTAMERYDLPYPEAIFDLRYFRSNPKPFFLLSAELLNADIAPTGCHRLLAALERTDKIELLVTQNIDMLHRKAGSRKVVECHGTYLSGHCQACGKGYGFDYFEKEISQGQIPRCGCGGVIKPDVVFFGETLPEEFMRLYFRPPEADLLLVLGTSLTVQPVAGFALRLAQQLPSILINREPGPNDDVFDLVHHGELDIFAAEAAQSLGLELT